MSARPNRATADAAAAAGTARTPEARVELAPGDASRAAPSATPAAAYINLSPKMQAFYAARGMWLDGQPRGELVPMLGERTPWAMPYGGACFWVTPQQIQALRNDLAYSGAGRALSGQQSGQFLRRLREAEARAGLPAFALRAMGAADAAPPSAGTAAPGAAVSFPPLVCPPAGTRARKAFEKHVFDCLRDVVDFQQTSAYGA